MKSMTSRERVLCACRRQQPDITPRHIALEGHVAENLRLHFGASDLQPYLQNDLHVQGPGATTLVADYRPYFRRSDVTWDEWGRGRIWDREGYYAEYLYPLENAETVAEIEEYPWPDLLEPYRYASLAKGTHDLHDAGFAVAGSLAETVFEIAWQLRSLDRLSEDLLTGSELGDILLDKIANRRVAAARAYAGAGADILWIGDDVAMQNGLMIGRSMFNTHLRPRMERVIAAAKEIKPDILIWYHTDGKINGLIPDLIAMGVEILNPVQPECVDHAWAKAEYGGTLAFSGGLGVQSVLPFGSPAEVREHVRTTIATLGAGGGFVVGPSHVVESDVPLANFIAMIDAIDEFAQCSD